MPDTKDTNTDTDTEIPTVKRL